MAKPKNLNYFNAKEEILKRIENNGGWVNAHCHLDRSYIISQDIWNSTYASLQDKWRLVDELRSESSVEQIYDRIAYSLEKQAEQGVTAICSFIDVDPIVKDKCIIAADKIKDKFNSGDFQVLFANQTLQGVLKPEAQKWFKLGAEFVDIIGGLPGVDKWFEEEHIDLLLTTARSMGKIVHVHVDQLNNIREKESEILAQKTIEHGMQGRVVAVHGVSLAAQPFEYRRKAYRLLREAGVMMITCPTAWIDSRRSEELTVTHNAIVPVDEIVDAGITVAIGPDDIADHYKPFSDGDMWTELRFLLESCHYYDIDNLVKIATKNGRKVLGLDKKPKKNYKLVYAKN